MSDALRVALVGNPNCGKTSLFNHLTGTRQKVANYAGVTVERKVGHFQLPSGRSVRVLDLPGTYSLEATSPDEEITRDVCQGKIAEEGQQDAFLCVVDATNLKLHLGLVLEIIELGRPILVGHTGVPNRAPTGLFGAADIRVKIIADMKKICRSHF